MWANEQPDDIEVGNYQETFNPFKCDMWSLGVCLEKMIGAGKNDNIEKLKGNKFLSNIIHNLKEEDWNKRFDSMALHNYITKNKLKQLTEKSGILQKDSKLVIVLNREKYERTQMNGKKY